MAQELGGLVPVDLEQVVPGLGPALQLVVAEAAEPVGLPHASP